MHLHHLRLNVKYLVTIERFIVINYRPKNGLLGVEFLVTFNMQPVHCYCVSQSQKGLVEVPHDCELVLAFS